MSARMICKLAEMYTWLTTPTTTNTTNTMNIMRQVETNYFYYWPYSRHFAHCHLYDSEGEESNGGYYHHHHDHKSHPSSHMQNQEPNPAGARTGLQEQPPFLKRIL